MVGRKGRGALALVLLVVVSSFLMVSANGPAAQAPSGSVPVRASATTVTPRAYYADSSYFEVNWTQTQDTCFVNYTFFWSPDLSHWTSYTITDPASTYVAINGFTAGTVIYWKVTDEDCSMGTATTPTYLFTTPQAGHLSYAWLNDNSIQMTWGTNYSYGGQGNLAFISQSVQYTGNGTIVWSTMDLANRNYTFTAPSPGSYGLDILTADTCNFCSPFNPNFGFSNQIQITTTAPVAATASVAQTTNEAGVPVTLTCAGSSGAAPYTYAWTFGDGQTGSGASVSHTYAASGSVDAACTVTDAHNGTATSHVMVTVNPGLSVTPTASSSSAAPGAAIVFNATVTGGTGGPYTVTWNFGDGSTGTGAVATHTYSAPGTYIPTVTVTDTLGGTKTVQLAAITIAAPLDIAVVGGIAAVIVVAAVAVAFLLMRRRKRGPAVPPPAMPPPASPPPNP